MNEKPYQVFGYRWVMLVTFAFVAFIAGMGFNAVAPLLGTIATQWSVSFGTAAILMSVYGFAQLLLSIPVGWLSGRVGYRWPIAGGATLLSIGFLLRPLAPDFGTFMIFSIISALGWGIIWAPVGSMIAMWFPHQEIGLANGLWPVGLTAGQAFGTLTAIPFLIGFSWTTTWWIYGVITAVVTLLTWLLLRSKPALPPEARPLIQPAGIRDGIAQTMNRTSLVLQYAVFATVGSIAAAPMLIAPMLIQKGVAPPTAGIISGLPLVGGTIGAFILPMFAFRNQRCRTTILISAALAVVLFYPIFLMPAGPGSVILPAVLSFLFGFFVLPVMGISMGVGHLQPGVNPGNAGILTGIFLTSIGLGAAVFPVLIGAMMDQVGLLGGALTQEILIIVSVILLAVFVYDPQLPEVTELQPDSA
jgi:predicted MFS family arabinose efflux permease